MTPVGGVRGELTLEIGRRLMEHARKHPPGRVVVGDVGFILRLPWDPERVRTPDCGLYCGRAAAGGEVAFRVH